LDENLDPKVKIAVVRLSPVADVLRVGDPGIPSLSTADPDLLRFCEVAQRILVTADRFSSNLTAITASTAAAMA
jgi:Domain of unknown function (DUF5615)